jgi:CPA1 family monovalent cation:H+ antiporter
MEFSLLTIVELLLVATLVGVAARRWRIPYSTALVLAGTAIGYGGLMPAIHLDAHIILSLFLPILVFGAAIETDATHLRENARPVAMLATFGLVIITGLTGALLHGLLGLDWPLALLLGTMLSFTDTVSVLAIFRNLRVPKRLAIIIEGESLLNDGTALVLFHVMLAIVLSGEVHLRQAVGEFFLVSIGGVVIGAGLGYLASQAVSQTKDHLVEILLTTALALGAYTLAEWLHASGIMAAVIAGLVVGNYGWRRSLSPSSQIALGSFWEYAGFGVNSAVFLMLGLSVDLKHIGGYFVPILLCLLAVHGGRMIAIYVGHWVLRRWARKPLPLAWQHVLVWGNMKGSLSVALALALPANVPQREFIVTLIFGVVLISLLTQGLSLGKLIDVWRVSEPPGAKALFEEAQVRLIAARAAQEELLHLQRAGILSTSSYERLRARYQVVVASAEKRLRSLGGQHPEFWDQSLTETRQRLMQIEKSAVLAARRERLISDEACQHYIEEVDIRSVTFHARDQVMVQPWQQLPPDPAGDPPGQPA